QLFCWTPVFLGAGAALWFSLATTPSIFAILFVGGLSLLAFLFTSRERFVLRAVIGCCVLILGGMALADLQTSRMATIILDSPVTTTIRGRILAREADANGRWRYLLAVHATKEPQLRRPPQVVRLTLSGSAEGYGLGSVLEGRARLSPPSGPALPGLNDFAFAAYFDGIGAMGYFLGAATNEIEPERTRTLPEIISETMETVRTAISERIRSVVAGDAGAFASSMVTDDRRAISLETTEALRLAGLAHIVAISGLNMALAAGVFFFSIRVVLSLSQASAHRLPVKKIAAAGALLSVTFYYLISGFAVSAERAYIMMVVVLVAALLGRPSISFRNVALSAILILVLTPSAVMGPGFQMSYAATLGLVAGYTLWKEGTRFHLPFPVPAWGDQVLRFVGGIFLTSLIGGLSTALYSAEHFHRLATWGLPANLLAMPIISFIVMPAGIVALVLMPFGLDAPALHIMGWGLEWVIAIAKWIASFKGEVVTGELPPWLFIGVTIGFLILTLMRTALRHLGSALIVLLLIGAMVAPDRKPPDLLVREDGAAIALVKGDDLALSSSRKDGFVTRQWFYALGMTDYRLPVTIATEGLPEPKRDAKAEDLVQARAAMTDDVAGLASEALACRKKAWCLGRLNNGLVVAWIPVGAYVGLACDRADIVVTPAPVRFTACRSGALLFSRQTLRRSGAIELRWPSAGRPPVLEASFNGDRRPWSEHRFYDWRTDSFADPE
ncbi:MAG: hypothetical protein RLZZ444_4549, partial [Pseudomonadota bacterium]